MNFSDTMQTEGAVVAAPAKRKKRKDIKTKIFIVCMLAYPVLQFLIFWVYVNFNSILMAFQNESGAFDLTYMKEFFRILFSSNPNELVRPSIINSIWFFLVGDFIGLPISLIYSYFMYKRVPGSKIFRVIFFLPSIISSVVLTSIYGYMLSADPSTGVINNIIVNVFGGETIPFLESEKYVLGSILFYGLWFGMGMNILLISGAIARIPEDIFEYSRLEGVGFFREFIAIVIPLIFDTISSIFIMGAVGMFTQVGNILLLSPQTYMHKTSTIGYYIYYLVQENMAYNQAAAAGLIFTCIGVPIIMGIRAIMNKICAGIEF